MDWLDSRAALARLKVLPQTLYAQVSRGRIRTRPHPEDSRRRQYHGDDVDRLAARQPGARRHAAVAAQAMGWGDPVLESSITTVFNGRPHYRGVDACTLAEAATLESVAALLWGADSPAVVRWVAPRHRRGRQATTEPRASAAAMEPIADAIVALGRGLADQRPAAGRSQAELLAEAPALVGRLLDAMLMGGGTTGSTGMPRPSASAQDRRLPVHVRCARHWQVPRAEDDIRRALVLLADHELNASTFATRVAISTGSPLSAALIAGLATLSGPRHGGAPAWLRERVAAAGRGDAVRTIRDSLASPGAFSGGLGLPAFGHPLYPEGDPRAAALLAGMRIPARWQRFVDAAFAVTGERPNIDCALAVMADVHRLPAQAPMVIFATARAVGWIAHALEQVQFGGPIRPRARYVGPMPPGAIAGVADRGVAGVADRGVAGVAAGVAARAAPGIARRVRPRA